ncbi:MFS transporter [Glutamicibacter ectropisis]|uniref:MFS transporter n=1 Tax=Glutamicibacter ectropisis TaxID=3046593 RepID=A0AAU6WC18_9MICC
MPRNTAAPPAQRSSIRKISLLALIEFATFGALVAPMAAALSLKVLELVPSSQKEASVALVTAVGGATALITNPLFGGLSDRTRSRFGRRRPWIFGGILVGLLASGLMLVSTSIPMLVIAWALAQAGYNAVFASLNAMLAEQIPDHERGKASGIFGAASALGPLSAYAIAALGAGSLPVMFLAMPALAAVIVVITCLIVKDPPPTSASTPRMSISAIFTSFIFDPRQAPNFAFLALQRFIMQTGYTLVGGFGLFFIMLRLKMPVEDATRLSLMTAMFSMVLMATVSWAVGMFVSRRGSYGGTLFVSIGLMITSLVLTAFTDDLTVYLLGVALSGIAMGGYYSVDLALAMRALPKGNEGKFLGIFNMAKTLPQTIAPAMAPALLLIGSGDPIAGGEQNYLALYLCAAAAVLLSCLAVIGFRTILSARAGEIEDTEPASLSVPEAAPVAERI